MQRDTMIQWLSDLAEEARQYLFDDPWHVNNRGHRIYAAALENILEAAGGIPEPADSTNWRK